MKKKAMIAVIFVGALFAGLCFLSSRSLRREGSTVTLETENGPVTFDFVFYLLTPSFHAKSTYRKAIQRQSRRRQKGCTPKGFP